MSSFTLPRWFSRTKSAKKRSHEGEGIYDNVSGSNIDFSNRPLPRTPDDPSSNYDLRASAGNLNPPGGTLQHPPPPPTLEDVVEARARLRKTVSVDEGIESAAAWMRPGDRRGIHLAGLDALPESAAALWSVTKASPAALDSSDEVGNCIVPAYANVMVAQAVVERAAGGGGGEELDSSSSHDSVFYDNAAAPKTPSGYTTMPSVYNLWEQNSGSPRPPPLCAALCSGRGTDVDGDP